MLICTLYLYSRAIHFKPIEPFDALIASNETLCAAEAQSVYNCEQVPESGYDCGSIVHASIAL